jgi:hypothetical protein
MKLKAGVLASSFSKSVIRVILPLLFFGVFFSTFSLFPPAERAQAAGNRYWVGGGSSAAWNATGPTNWGTASDTRDNASVPDASNDVIFDNSANGNTPCTLSTTTTINSLVMTGWTNTLTQNTAVTLTIDSQDGAGNSLLMVAGMTYSSTGTALITFTGTGTSKITTGGKAINRISFNNASGTFQLQDDLILSGTGSIGVLTFYELTGTFSPNGKTVTFTGAASYISAGAGKTPTFYNLTRTGNATFTDSLTLASNITVTNNFVASGQSASNRLLVSSSGVATARTITAAAVDFDNVDFQDITFAGVMSITGADSVGDCGGNSGVNWSSIVSPAVAQTWTDATGGNWSDSGNWTSRVPLPQDDVDMDLSGGGDYNTGVTVTADMPRLGKSISWLNATWGQE